MPEASTALGSRRNAAHQGPVFLPWHRLMLMLLERNMQRVLGKATFGLPYWDWAADGELPVSEQSSSPLWDDTGIGGGGDPADSNAVKTGPFRDTSAFRVRIWADSANRMWAVDRPLRRRFAPAQPRSGGFSLPKRDHIAAALDLDYDDTDWDFDSTRFRNMLEGWLPLPDPALPDPNLHNRVHVWVGGDMAPSTSPNDPVFYLNHCNVDRLWAAWQSRHGNRNYAPSDDEDPSLFRHRPSDPLLSFFARDNTGAPWRVSDMFDVSTIYTYDTLD